MRCSWCRVVKRVFAIVTLAVLGVTLAGCSAFNLTGDIQEMFSFGDVVDQSSIEVDRMYIPDGGLGPLIGDEQIDALLKPTQALCDYSKDACTIANDPNNRDAARGNLMNAPNLQCIVLSATVQEESPDEGLWEYVSPTESENGRQYCHKDRELTWLEAMLWSQYQKQSNATIDWLTTSRNTLVAAPDTVSTLQSNATPSYDDWFGVANDYLSVFQGLLVICAALSLMVLGVRVVSNTRDGLLGEDHHLLDKAGWICLGVFIGSTCVSIALNIFSLSRQRQGTPVITPALTSWTPGSMGTFYVSDWVRLQVDPFLIIAAVLGVLAAGFKLVTNQEGRDLVPLGKAFMWAIVTAVCLAGATNLLMDTVDGWTNHILQTASDMVQDAWYANSLHAGEFFDLDPLLAILLVVILWIANLVGKIFTYLRAGMIPIMVGVAPMFAAMSWSEQGKQSFSKVMGWLVAFLLYKPVAALLMATGSAIMVTAGTGDDSMAITLTLTLMTVILLPVMIKTVVPAVASSISGAGSAAPALAATAGVAGMAAGSLITGGIGLMGKGAHALRGGHGKHKDTAPDGAASASSGGSSALKSASTSSSASAAPSSSPSASLATASSSGGRNSQAPKGAANTGASNAGIAPEASSVSSAAGSDKGFSAQGAQHSNANVMTSLGSASASGAVQAVVPPDGGQPDGADRGTSSEGGVRKHGF